MSNKESETNSDAPKGKSSNLGYFGVLFALALIAIGAGWFGADLFQLSKMDASDKAQAPEIKVKNKEKKETAEAKGDGDEPGMAKPETIILDPIIVALQKSDNAFMRIELALVPAEGAEISSKEELLRIGSDIAAFTQSLTLQQISGPTGNLHFREDILDRVRLVTNGKVKDLLILSMVAE